MQAGSISRSARRSASTGSGPINIFSMGGLILCQALASTPFVFLLLTSTLRAMDPALEEASGASGASPLTTFRRVTLPVLLPGLLAPLILVTLITAEQFELPLIIGLPAKINVFSYRIYFELNPLASLPNYGARRGAVAALRRARRAAAARLQSPDQARGQLRHGHRARLPAATPAARRLAHSRARPGEPLYRARRDPSRRRAAVDELFRLRAAALARRRAISAWKPIGSCSPIAAFWLGLRNTFLVALAVRADRDRDRRAARLDHLAFATRFGTLLDFVSFLSVGIPAVIAGLGVMLLYLSLPIGLYGTVWILVIAYSYRFATTTRLARAGFLQIHKELEEASAASGARWLATQRRILLPLMLPALAAGLHAALHRRRARVHHSAGALQPGQRGAVGDVVAVVQSGQPAPSAALGVDHRAVVLPVIFLARRYLRAARRGGLTMLTVTGLAKSFATADGAVRAVDDVSFTVAPRRSSTRCWARAAAARPRRCAASPGLEQAERGSIAIGGTRGLRCRRRASSCRCTSAPSAWCSSPTRSGRTWTCSTTSPIRSRCARPRVARGRDRAARHGRARAGRHAGDGAPAGDPAFRRPAAAGGAGARHRAASRACCCSTSRCPTSTPSCASHAPRAVRR